MREDTKKRIEAMNPEQQQRRFEEINRRLGPHEISCGREAPVFVDDELPELREERDYLMKKLGYGDES